MPRLIPTPSDLLELFKVAAESKVLDAQGRPRRLNWSGTSRLNAIRTAVVRLHMRLFYVAEDRFRASFLETAEREDLDAWARSEAPGYPRLPASAATGTVLLTRAASPANARTIPAGSRFSTTATANVPAVVFASIRDVTIPSGIYENIAVDVRCEQTGPGGNVDRGTINRALSNLGESFTIIARPGAGGSLAESDADYKSRLRQRDARVRRGTKAATILGAKSVPGVSRVTVIQPPRVGEAQTSSRPPPGELWVVVGDQNGVGSAPMAAAVEAVLPEWMVDGIVPTVFPMDTLRVLHALPSSARIRITPRMAAGALYDRTAIQTAMLASLGAYMKSLGAKQTLRVQQLIRVALETHPSIRNVVFEVVDGGVVLLVDLSGDLLSPGQRWDIATNDWAFAGTWPTEI